MLQGFDEKKDRRINCGQNKGEIVEKLLAKKTVQRFSYPWNELEVGQSFFINCDDVNETSLRTMVSNRSRTTGKVFKCFKRKNENMFEITYISDNRTNLEFEKVPLPVNPCSKEAQVEIEKFRCENKVNWLNNVPINNCVWFTFKEVQNFNQMKELVDKFNKTNETKQCVIIVHRYAQGYEFAVFEKTPKYFERSEVAAALNDSGKTIRDEDENYIQPEGRAFIPYPQ